MHQVLMSSGTQGLLTAFMALGVLLTFRMLGFPDLTVAGSFPLGAAVTARLLIGHHSPAVGLVVATLAGAVAGLATGLIHTKLKINAILAGILVSAAIYSLMFRIMHAPNVSLLSKPSVFTDASGWFSLPVTDLANVTLVCLAVLAAAVIAVLYWFLKTDFGVLIRATGTNPRMLRGLAVNLDVVTVLAIAISNGLVALSGALTAQFQAFADVSMGTTAFVAAIASVVIGEVIVGRRRLLQHLIAVAVGAFAYQVILNLGLRSGLPATDFQMVTSVLLLIALALPSRWAEDADSNLGGRTLPWMAVQAGRAIVGWANDRRSAGRATAQAPVPTPGGE